MIWPFLLACAALCLLGWFSADYGAYERHLGKLNQSLKD